MEGQADENNNGIGNHDDANDIIDNDGSDSEMLLHPWGAPAIVLVSREERQRAVNLKREIEKSGEIRNLPDYDYLHLVIALWDDNLEHDQNIHQALNVAFKLQCLRDQYRIQDTVQDGLSAIRSALDLHPGMILETSYLPQEETFWFVIDYACFHGSRMKSEMDWRAIQVAIYYIYRAVTSDVQSIRNGLITMVECEGATVENFDMDVEYRAFQEMRGYYPIKYKETFVLHTPMAGVLFLNLIKRFMNDKQKATLHNAKSFMEYEGRIDVLFKNPSLEIAEEHMLQRLEAYLKERYKQEAEFRL